jgi:phospholipid/cholesterol/gamma-HCH transport system ATP-binding protein
MIEIKNIYKSFEQKEVLKNISKVFNKGETNLIIGRSGSGKTVLLKSIVGLHEVDKGQILYDNRNFTSMNSVLRKKLRQEMGMVFQGGALFDSLTVEENVRFPLDMFSVLSPVEKQKQVDFCLERVNISNANKLSPSEISGGMKKRVAIARAIVLNPKYLFCDEPNSGLDPETSLVIDDLIHSITVDLQITTIINTHDMNSVMEIGDNILFISEGEMCWEGNRKEILHSDNQKLQEFVFANKQYQRLRDDKINEV